MSDKIDLKKMEQRANRLLNQDGLTEMLLGAIFFVSSASISGQGSFVPFLPIYVIFMKQIVESFRNRFTYPRIGYVKIPDEESEDVGRGILTFVGGIMVLFVVGIYLSSGGISFNSLYKWLPLGIGVFLFGPFQYLYNKTGDKVNWLYIAVSILGGLVFSLQRFTETREGPQRFMLAISLFFILAGLARFTMFTKNNPVLEVPQDE